MQRRRWLGLATRTARLILRPRDRTADLVRRSYDRVAPGYDDAWTGHMRGCSVRLLDRLAPPAGASCVDLTCGTGFVTGELQRRTGGPVVGVDSSAGMIQVAHEHFGNRCKFFQADAVEFLRSCSGKSVDVITCGWGLGYTRPWLVLTEAARVLRPGGAIGVIDNSLFSLAGILWVSMLTFAERPEALIHAMQVRFLPGSWALAALMRLAGFAVLESWDGSKTYHVPDGRSAVDRLTATGAAAGFEFAAAEAQRDAVFYRFAELLDRRHRSIDRIPITHRYLAAVGRKR